MNEKHLIKLISLVLNIFIPIKKLIVPPYWSKLLFLINKSGTNNFFYLLMNPNIGIGKKNFA